MPSRRTTSAPTSRSRSTDDTKSVGFIVHKPGLGGAGNQEPGGDRTFMPIEHPEIWLVAGDPTVYFVAAGMTGGA